MAVHPLGKSTETMSGPPVEKFSRNPHAGGGFLCRDLLPDQQQHGLTKIAGELLHFPFHFPQDPRGNRRAGRERIIILSVLTRSVHVHLFNGLGDASQGSIPLANKKVRQPKQSVTIRSSGLNSISPDQLIERLSANLLGLTGCGEPSKVAIQGLVMPFK